LANLFVILKIILGLYSNAGRHGLSAAISSLLQGWCKYVEKLSLAQMMA